jgi:hypothetical protein
MNSFHLLLIVIITLISIILIYIRKLRDKRDITHDIKQDVETKEIDDLFNNTIEEVNTHLPQKIKQKKFRVILKNKGWWNRNNSFIGVMCAILFIAILILVLSNVAHKRYNLQQEITIQKEHQKMSYEDSIQNNKDSIKNEQIELISSKLSEIDKTIRETNRIIHRIEKQIKDITENDF